MPDQNQTPTPTPTRCPFCTNDLLVHWTPTHHACALCEADFWSGPSDEARRAIEALQSIDAVLYADGPDTEWDSDTLDDVASILRAFQGGRP